MLSSIEATKVNIEATGLCHRIYVPEETEQKRPGVILVHGRAGNANVMWTFAKTFEELRPVAVSPQAFLEDPIGGFSWWKVQGDDGESSTAYRRLEPADVVLALEKIERFVEKAITLYKMDPSQLLAYGFSQGAALVGMLSLRRPDLFKGVALLSGFIPGFVFSEPGFINSGSGQVGNRLPSYFMAHGRNDPVVPLHLAEKVRNNLEQIGAQVVFVTDDVEHKVGTSGMKSLGAWVKEFHRA